MPDRLYAAVAAGVMASEEDFTRLLRSIVEVARAIFGAQGSSIFLLDEEADELVFAAVASEEEQFLVGQRFPSSTGHRRLGRLVADAARARGRAEPTLASPATSPSGAATCRRASWPSRCSTRNACSACSRCSTARRTRRFSLQEMELLGLFAGQAAIALSLLMTARSARAALAGDAEASLVAELAGALDRLEGEPQGRGRAPCCAA